MNMGGMGGGFDRGNRGDRQWQTETLPQAPTASSDIQPDRFPGQAMQTMEQPTSQSSMGSSLLPLLLSAGALLLGLLIVRKYRR